MKTPRDFGAKGDGLTDDTVALRKWSDGGGGSLGDPLDRYRLVMDAAGRGMTFGSGFRLTGGGRILVRGGWPSGYALCTNPAGWPNTITGDVVIDGSNGASMELDGIGSANPKVARKLLGLTYLDGFTVNKFGLFGGASVRGGDSFTMEARGVRNGRITGPRSGGDIVRALGGVGSDGLHVTDYAYDLFAQAMDVHTGDDGCGITSEIPQFNNRVFERITLSSCIWRADGFSGVKALIKSALAGKSISDVIMRDLAILNCRIELALTTGGAGVPIIGINAHRDTGCLIDGLSIIGGQTNVTVPPGGQIGGACLDFAGVDRLLVQRHRIRHWHRMAIRMDDCPGAQITGCDISSDDPKTAKLRPVPKPSTPCAVIHATNSLGARIDTALVKPGWTGQALA